MSKISILRLKSEKSQSKNSSKTQSYELTYQRSLAMIQNWTYIHYKADSWIYMKGENEIKYSRSVKKQFVKRIRFILG